MAVNGYAGARTLVHVFLYLPFMIPYAQINMSTVTVHCLFALHFFLSFLMKGKGKYASIKT